jgi:hypothetical protein
VGVVGDLREGEARCFTQETMDRMRRRQRQKTLLIEEGEWARVYEVCGGNPQRLTRALHLWGDALLEAEAGGEEGDRLTALESGKGEQTEKNHRLVVCHAGTCRTYRECFGFVSLSGVQRCGISGAGATMCSRRLWLRTRASPGRLGTCARCLMLRWGGGTWTHYYGENKTPCVHIHNVREVCSLVGYG